MKLHRLLAATSLGLIAASTAQAQTDRTVLPIPRAPFDGTIAENVLDADPGTTRPVEAPAGAPNVLMFMSDDVGFAMSSAFGGPVPTPNFDRLAQAGQRYNRFHSTGICSPSRAALLTSFCSMAWARSGYSLVVWFLRVVIEVGDRRQTTDDRPPICRLSSVVSICSRRQTAVTATLPHPKCGGRV